MTTRGPKGIAKTVARKIEVRTEMRFTHGDLCRLLKLPTGATFTADNVYPDTGLFTEDSALLATFTETKEVK